MKTHLIILGAGKSRGLVRPFGLEAHSEGLRILDWQLSTYRHLFPKGSVTFVGGHQVEQVSEAFPDLHYLVNGLWRTTGASASLALALEHFNSGNAPDWLFVLYGDVLVRAELYQQFVASAVRHVCVGVDPGMPTETVRGSPGELLRTGTGKSAEFVGFLGVPRVALSDVQRVFGKAMPERAGDHLSEVLSQRRGHEASLKLHYHDCSDHWSHGENSQAVARFIMGSKAETLSRLQARLKRSHILPQRAFTFSQWYSDSAATLADIQQTFGDHAKLVVRSSAHDEDGFTKASAGKYHTELNVTNSSSDLGRAIDAVFASYADTRPDDEVLIQPHLDNVVISGVLFTRQLGTGAPYYIINYVRGTDTTAVTSGQAKNDETIVCSRNFDPSRFSHLPIEIRELIAAAAEMEKAVLYDALDIEFAILATGEIVTLQCRPLMLQNYLEDRRWDDVVFDIQSSLYEQLIGDEIDQTMLGDKPVWSVMADWNPAEIVGTQPGALALDLYRYVITDHTWAVPRRDVGYRDVTHASLVSNLAGTAFVNVRSSLNSFVPAAFPVGAGRRLVSCALERLRDRPELHDKIEFEVMPTCMDFAFDRWRDVFAHTDGLTSDELDQLQSGLLQITRNIIARTQSDHIRAQILEREYDALLAQCADQGVAGVQRLLDQCRNEGALIFAHLARAGFVAMSLLKTAVDREFLTRARYQTLLSNVQTVSTLLQKHAQSVRDGHASQTSLAARFGHIRPGTYDISTPSYGAAYDTYLEPLVRSVRPTEPSVFIFTGAEMRAIEEGLKDIGMEMSAQDLATFVQEAIAGREFSKFVFTKLISGALDMIREDQLHLGIREEDLDFISLADVLKRPHEHWGRFLTRQSIQQNIDRRRTLQKVSSRVLLPPVIVKPEDVYGFVQPHVVANFITDKRVEKTITILTQATPPQGKELEDRIVAIPNADPGYDFLFGMKIAGLVTAYGGPNSHMAIRATEFQLPASIGIGQSSFSHLVDGGRYVLDCARKLLQPAQIGPARL